MLPDLTLCPVLLSLDLAGLDRLARISMLRLYVSRVVASMLAAPDDTALTLRASGSILWLYAAISAA